LHNRVIAGEQKFNTNKQTGGARDLIEHHYKMALSLRPNFALAALNLAAYQYGQLDQLAEAWKSYARCAFQMRPEETKTFVHHVQIQIECLISGAKLSLKQRILGGEQTNGKSRQTTTAGPKSPSSTLPPSDCATIFKWTEAVLTKTKQIGPQQAALNLGLKGAAQGEDLGAKLASVHWIRAQCSTNRSQTEIELARAVGLALGSQFSIAASLYKDYADFLIESGRQTEARETLGEAIARERAKLAGKGGKRAGGVKGARFELAQLHHKLALLLPTSDGLREMEESLRLEPNNINFLNAAAQLAYRLGWLERCEEFYSRALAFALDEQRQMEAARGGGGGGRSGGQINRKLSTAYTNYGAILQVLGRPHLAQSHYRRALDWDPSNSAARSNARLPLGGQSGCDGREQAHCPPTREAQPAAL